MRPGVTPVVGQRFGDFELLRLLGKGSFSEVYLAKQESLVGRYVAVKIVKRIMNEPSHLARLQHTGIVPLHSVHQVGEYSVLCMPYAGSATLQDWLKSSDSASRHGQSFLETVKASRYIAPTRSYQRSGAQDEQGAPQTKDDLAQNFMPSVQQNAVSGLGQREFTVWLAYRLAEALAHAHQRGVVHGDIKPANILLRHDSEPALIDFNLSQSSGGDYQAVIGGTLPYMAPEQLQALMKRQVSASPSSDVFALGVVLFELMEGRLPYSIPRSASEADLETAIRIQEQSQLEWQCRVHSLGLQAIVSKCLAIRPEDRYENASKLLEDVDRERLHLPLRHAHETMRGRLLKLPRRHPLWFSSGALSLFSLLIIGLVAWTALAAWGAAQRSSAANKYYEIRALTQESMIEQANGGAADSLQSGAVAKLESLILDVNTKSVAEAEFLEWLPDDQSAQARSDLAHFFLLAACLLHERQRADSTAPTERPLYAEEIERCLRRCRECLPDEETLAVAASPRVTSPQKMLLKANSRPEEALVLARLMLASPTPARAAEFLLPLSDQSPYQALYWLSLGEAQLRERKFTEARSSLSRGCALAPGMARAYQLRAEAGASQGDVSAAIDDYSEAIRLLPGRASLYADRARIHEMAGSLELAIADVSHAIELEPDSNRLWIFRSRLYRQAGELQKAHDDFGRAIEIRPNTEADWISRALAKSQNSPEAALEDLQQALAINPRSTTALQNKAYVESEIMERGEQAIETLTQLLTLASSFEPALGGRCVLLARLGKEEEALADIEQLLAKGQRRLEASTVYQIACAYSLMSEGNAGNHAEALRYLALALQRNYGVELLASDPDLDRLRSDSLFESLQQVANLMTDDEQ
jgi:eukaryotic-like serine/threonine-protein kinase